MLNRLVKRGVASGRIDDNMECAMKRIEVFHKESQSVIEAFKERVNTIEADHSVDDVSSFLFAVYSFRDFVEIILCKS